MIPGTCEIEEKVYGGINVFYVRGTDDTGLMMVQMFLSKEDALAYALNTYKKIEGYEIQAINPILKDIFNYNKL